MTGNRSVYNCGKLNYATWCHGDKKLNPTVYSIRKVSISVLIDKILLSLNSKFNLMKHLTNIMFPLNKNNKIKNFKIFITTIKLNLIVNNIYITWAHRNCTKTIKTNIIDKKHINTLIKTHIEILIHA